MSFGTRWTKEDIDALKKQRKAEIRLEETECRNHGIPMGTLKIKTIAPKKRELMNATEKLWFAELQRRGHKIILCQAITLRLGDRMTYRPDFVTVESLYNLRIDEGQIRLTCWETKGPHRFKTAGVTKLKAAAAIYPWIKFVLVERNKSQWSERIIGL